MVSAHHTADHDWHNGVGMAIPEVNGTSFWGGGTYVPGREMAADNHGVIVGRATGAGQDAFTQELSWIGHNGSVALYERRSIGWTASTSRLEIDLRVPAVGRRDAELGSPGSKGRIGGGYGGFFWRFPACDNVEVFTAEATGEEKSTGSVAPWIGWSADFAAGPGISGPATIVIASPDALAARGALVRTRPQTIQASVRRSPGIVP